MAKNKHPSPLREVSQRLKEQLRLGESKHEAKRQEGTASSSGIFSIDSYLEYVEHGTKFYSWTKKTHGCKTIDEAKSYAREYIEMRKTYRKRNGEHLSAWTLKSEAAAIAKLYTTSTEELGLETPSRKREDIVRSRGVKAHDSHFSEEKNQDTVRFCKGCGLRRSELTALLGKDVFQKDGKTYVHVRGGKGGKERTVYVLPEYAEHIQKMAEKVKPNEKIFPKGTIRNRMDVHSYRRKYAQSLYERLARPLNTLPEKEKYRCRSDKSGMVYDRWAMSTVSQNLGHNRVSVIASHYLS